MAVTPNIIQIWHPIHNVDTPDPLITYDPISNFILAFGFMHHLTSGKLVIKLAAISSSAPIKKYVTSNTRIHPEYIKFIHTVASNPYRVNYYDSRLRMSSYICSGLCIMWQ